MIITSTTNIKELEEHLTRKFKGMMKSQEMLNAGKQASDAMKRSVKSEIEGGGASGYDYEQTGDLYTMIKKEIGDIKQTAGGLSIGFGGLDDFTDGVYAKRNFQTQRHWIGSRKNGRYITVSLKEESQMPKWIIAEFGSGSKSDDTNMPNAFKISYTKRSKPYMFGPSVNTVGDVEAGYSGRKKGYFMIGRKGMQNLYGNKTASGNKHPGVKAGKIFSRGLNKSKIEVQGILRDGINKYLDS